MGKPILRPCPYCGGMAYVSEQMNRRYIDCNHAKNCLIKPNTWLISSEKINNQIKAWNIRAGETN